MIDFTSALYLGLRHPSRSLRPWRELTTGVPAALGEPVEAREIAVQLARLQGFAAGALASSTLHLAWDVFGLLAQERITVYMDAGAYAISRWGAARATLLGMQVREFPHHDARTLRAAMERDHTGGRPVVVTDGFCPACGRAAPLVEYLASARSRGGWLVTDDTQAIGILGRSPTPAMPYGYGGGGSFQWRNVHGPDVIVIASLAKAFGVPIAIVAGSGDLIDRFRRSSDTRVHCSPPSIATLRAAEHAILRNRHEGGVRRARVLASVRQFRRGVRRAQSFRVGSGLFPLQTIHPPSEMSAAELHGRLLERGIRTVLQRGESGKPHVSFLITAEHTPETIDHAVRTLTGIATIQPTEERANHHEDLVAHGT